MKNTLTSIDYFILYGVLAIAYAIGLFVPLMDSDAAHHANIALHMYLHHDFVSLIDRGKDYLDKPHLLFWLAGASYYTFGVNAFAYKLPSFLMSVAAVFATKKLGERLYNKDTGNIAALMLAAAQAFILACNDVRMDAILTACIILATWQLVEVVEHKKWYHFVLAALFMAMGFSTKGQVGIIMPAAALFFYLLYKRDFREIFHTQWLIIGILLVLFMMPELYCYYLQFDRHPEKVIRGMKNVSGVKFILWGQNIERLDGKNWGGGGKDYFFYFHTLLWAFLPWSIVAYYAIGSKMGHFVKTRFAYQKRQEGLTIGTIIVIFILISLSQFQLPHYLNILFPFFAIISASKIMDLYKKDANRKLQIIFLIQLIIVLILCIGAVILSVWMFPVTNVIIIIVGLLVWCLIMIFLVSKNSLLVKTIAMSVCCMAFVNILLNGNFYPKLLQYQAGRALAKKAGELNITNNKIAFYNTHSFSFDFERKNLATIYNLQDIQNRKDDFWVYTDAKGLDTLKMIAAPLGKMYQADQFRVTRLNLRFLNPATRAQTLGKSYLVQINHTP